MHGRIRFVFGGSVSNRDKEESDHCRGSVFVRLQKEDTAHVIRALITNFAVDFRKVRSRAISTTAERREI